MKRVFVVFVLAVFSLSMLGCASMRKDKDLEIQALRNQVSVLEAQIQNKDDEISSLKEVVNKKEIAQATEIKVVSLGKNKKKLIGEIKKRPTVKQIQIALSNAGYDPGTLDGKMGKQTKDAIKAFQGANNLPADGRVGAKTWEILKEHLYNKDNKIK